MTERTYTDEDLEQLLPRELRGLLVVNGIELTQDGYDLVAEPLRTAAKTLAPATILVHRVLLTFGESPFQLETNEGAVTIDLKPEVAHWCGEGMVFIDLKKLAMVQPPFRVAGILEELCHAFMHIRDEDLVKRIVARLYPQVTWDGKKYRLASQPGR